MNITTRSWPWLFGVVLVLAALLAVVGARPYAASYNDGSRLATIEALVDYHTFSIDETIYVAPGSGAAFKHRPYYMLDDGWDNLLHERGTLDKILVKGHFYSHQPAVPALLLAGPYWLIQRVTGLRADERPDWFAYCLTLLGCGVPYVIAVAAVGRTTRLVGISPLLSLALTASFAFATIAAAYSRQLNANMMLLAVAALVFMLLADLSRASGTLPLGQLLQLGLLNGCAYAIEQPVGGLLLAGTGLVLLYRRPSLRTALLYGVALLPGVAAHQGVNYWITGGWRPAGQITEFFNYPGAEFDATNMTGVWNHHNINEFLLYVGRLVYSDRGFLSGNVPLFLLIPGGVLLLRSKRIKRPLLWLAALWCVGVGLVYASLSNNCAGCCCSIRWFVPLLAASYYLLALLLRERPDLTPDFLLLSAWGALLAANMWWEGPWAYEFGTYWPVQILALLSWAGYRGWRAYAARHPSSFAATPHGSV